MASESTIGQRVKSRYDVRRLHFHGMCLLLLHFLLHQKDVMLLKQVDNRCPYLNCPS